MVAPSLGHFSCWCPLFSPHWASPNPPEEHRVAETAKLIVLSAPSGAGKNTLIARIRARGIPVAVTVSATTRSPRPGEVSGEHYYFISRDEFQRKLVENAFYEWAEVHGNFYGTLCEEVDRCLASGSHVMLELDVQGWRHMRTLRPDAVSIFLMPPSFEELERRLRARGANDEADIQLRLKNARAEVAARDEFDYVIVNDDLERAAAELEQVLLAPAKQEGQR